MDPILDDLRAALADLTPEIPTIPFYSTVTEGVTSPPTVSDLLFEAPDRVSAPTRRSLSRNTKTT